MDNWLFIPNIAMAASALLLMLMGLILSIVSPGMDRWNRRFFILFFSFMTLSSICFLLDQVLYLYRDMRIPSMIVLYLESLFSSLLMPMLTIYLLQCCGEDWRKSALFRIVAGLWSIYFILLGITQFTTQIYYITEENIYYRGPMYPLLLAPMAVAIAIDLVGLLRRRKKLNPKQKLAFLIYLIVPLAAVLVQMCVYGLMFTGLGMAIGAMAMFIMLLTDQIERYVKQQQEIARQRASIMVLQMRPHFIHNTMMSIYYLCAQDTDKAQRVILDFNSYLRKTFTAIAREDMIPFAEALEHTRAYLAVEQVRFEGRLFVTMDAPHTAFQLPPLTLQPIVENAVKYGVDPELKPLHILLRTQETPRGSVITVEDDGPGFGTPDSGEPHIALDNIRARLRMMCGGTLTIQPREEGGTRVTVEIPEKK